VRDASLGWLRREQGLRHRRVGAHACGCKCVCVSCQPWACFHTCLQLSKLRKCFLPLQAVHLQRGKSGRHHGESAVNGSGRKGSLDVQR
ncbi:hypothetical protein KUCAC02_027194, partial [Chaenocephalus aceratus]